MVKTARSIGAHLPFKNNTSVYAHSVVMALYTPYCFLGPNLSEHAQLRAQRSAPDIFETENDTPVHVEVCFVKHRTPLYPAPMSRAQGRSVVTSTALITSNGV